MTRSEATDITLAKSALIRLPETARNVICESGSLWITQDGDLRDIMLEPGQQYDRDGTVGTIVYALAPSRITVHHAQPAPAAARSQSRHRPRALVLDQARCHG